MNDNKDKKTDDLAKEVFTTGKTAWQLIAQFFVFFRVFIVTLFKRIFSKENKKKVKIAVIVFYRKTRQLLSVISNAVLFVLKVFCESVILFFETAAGLFNSLFKEISGRIFSEKNKNAVKKIFLYIDSNMEKIFAFMLQVLKNIYKKVFSNKNKKLIYDSAYSLRILLLGLYYKSLRIGYDAKNRLRSLLSKYVPKRYLNAKTAALGVTALFLVSCTGLTGGVYLSLPDVKVIKHYHPEETTQIFDRNNVLLAKIHNDENRIVISADKLPEHVKNSVIAMEDERFYEHNGVDIKAIIRSFFSLIVPGDLLVESGGSTITQQLARNIYLSRERSFSRKFKEILLALKIERHLSKDRILEVYLNEVYWGHNAYGIEAAAKTYFGKPAGQLNMSEAAMLAGMLSGPEIYSPYKDMEKAKWRQELALQNMVRNRFISETDAMLVKKVPLKLNNTLARKKYKMQAPYFTSFVIAQLKEKYGEDVLKKSGLKVYTTIDLKEQQEAEKIVTSEINKLKGLNITQGSLISLEPKTGQIRAMVGGTDYEKSQFNRVTQALRQPGSAFKPVIYLAAFKEKIVTPNTYIKDEPISFNQYGGKWSPDNYDNRFRGYLTVKDAVKYSVNTVAVRMAAKLGVVKVMNTAKELGVESKLYPNLSLALGTSEVTPLELAKVYTVFANKGKRLENISAILRIEDKQGKVIESFSQPGLEQMYSEEPFKMLDSTLKATVERGGTSQAASIPGYQVAGKTGTSSNNKDSWFAGYTPELVTVVWAGNDDNSDMRGATGGSVCAPIWKKYMSAVLKSEKTQLVRN